MEKTSAGLLMFRRRSELEVFLVHPGGPFYVNKDEGHWSIPKGELNPQETPMDAALREFNEETGLTPHGEYIPLGSTILNSGKTIHAWAFEGDWDGMLTKISTFTLEWPPKSGKIKHFPEVDKAGFFTISEAKKKIHPSQSVFLERLAI